jgi:uroporphyrinogen decarboxylase
VEIFKPGGGFVFSQIHNIQAGTPPENIEAMYQAVHDHWTYGRVPS